MHLEKNSSSIKIKKIKALNTVFTSPGSKYISNRAFIIATLAHGKSLIKNVYENEDIKNLIRVLRELNINIIKEKNDFIIHGGIDNFTKDSIDLNVGESGTLLRFIISVSALLKGKTTISGEGKINKRPVADLLSALEQTGIKTDSQHGFSPVKIYGGKFNNNKILLNPSVSSQYLSSLLMISPFFSEGLNIELTENPVSEVYINMTIKLMRKCGVNCDKTDKLNYYVSPGQHYLPFTYEIPGDICSASYFMALAAIIPGRIEIMNIDNTIGEMKFVEALKEMGCYIKLNEKSIIVEGKNDLKGIEIDMKDSPDSVLSLIPVAANAKGRTIIKNIDHLKFKECDRINKSIEEFSKTGMKIFFCDNNLVIEESEINEAIINPHNDHRLAMSTIILGLKHGGLTLENPQCINKSFPDFLKIIENII